MKAHGSTILVLRMAVRVKVGFRSSGAVPDPSNGSASTVSVVNITAQSRGR